MCTFSVFPAPAKCSTLETSGREDCSEEGGPHTCAWSAHKLEGAGNTGGLPLQPCYARGRGGKNTQPTNQGEGRDLAPDVLCRVGGGGKSSLRPLRKKNRSNLKTPARPPIGGARKNVIQSITEEEKKGVSPSQWKTREGGPSGGARGRGQREEEAPPLKSPLPAGCTRRRRSRQ